MLRGTLIVLVLGRQVGSEFFVDTRNPVWCNKIEVQQRPRPAGRKENKERRRKKRSSSRGRESSSHKRKA